MIARLFHRHRSACQTRTIDQAGGGDRVVVDHCWCGASRKAGRRFWTRPVRAHYRKAASW